MHNCIRVSSRWYRDNRDTRSTAAACTSLTAYQTPTFAVKQQEVRLEVLVTMHNKPLHGLTADDFEVFDNGVRQRVNFVNEAHTPFNAVLVLDMSMSVAGDRLFHLKSAGTQFLDALKKDERAALVTFSNVLLLDTELTDETWDIEDSTPCGHPAVLP